MTDERKTTPLVPIETPNLWRDFSNRLLRVELALLKQADLIKDLTDLMLNNQLNSNRTTYEIADAKVKQLDKTLVELREKREELAKQRAAETDPLNIRFLEMQDDTLAQREDRTRSDRNDAYLRREKSNEFVNDTNQKLDKMKMRDQTLSFPPIQTEAKKKSIPDQVWDFFRDNYLKIIILAILAFIWEAVRYYFIGKVNGTIP